MSIDVSYDHVEICGVRVPRPSYISRADWLAYWESVAWYTTDVRLRIKHDY